MAGKFEIFKGKKGEYRFRLKASNGQTILASEKGYKAKTSCKNGIESVRKNAIDEARFDRKVAKKTGNARFYLKAGNGQVIAASETYKTIKSRDNGIASVAKHAPVAKIADLSVSA